MNTGGPVMIVWGWPVVGLMTLAVGLAMAEVCSSYPDRRRPLLLGREAGRPQRRRLVLVHRLVQLPRPGRGDRGHRLRRRAVHHRLRQPAVELRRRPGTRSCSSRACCCCTDCSTPSACGWSRCSTRSASGGTCSAWRSSSACWPSSPSHHQSASFVFGHFVNNTGWASSALRRAARPAARAVHLHRLRRLGAHDRGDPATPPTAGPRGIVMSIWSRWIAGWVLLIGITFAIQDYAGEAGLGHRRAARADLHRRRSAPPAASCCC